MTDPLAHDIMVQEDWKSEKTGKISADEEVLTFVLNNSKQPETIYIVTKLLKYRELSKQLQTYIQGLGKHVIKVNKQDYIYSRINQVTTATGRLSSTTPNIQNISNNPIKIWKDALEKSMSILGIPF